MKKIKFIVSLFFLFIDFKCFAEKTPNTGPLSIDNTNIYHSKLTNEEKIKYKDILSGSRKYLSPNIDPITALGIESQSEAERRHYAELLTLPRNPAPFRNRIPA